MIISLFDYSQFFLSKEIKFYMMIPKMELLQQAMAPGLKLEYEQYQILGNFLAKEE